MEIKTTEEILTEHDLDGEVWIKVPNSKKWVAVDDILKEIKTIDKWHSTHRTKSLIKTLEDV